MHIACYLCSCSTGEVEIWPNPVQRGQGKNPAVSQQLEDTSLEECGDLCHVSYHRNNTIYLHIHILLVFFIAKIEKFWFM